VGAKFLLFFLPTTILTSLFAAISILLSLGTPTPAADYPNRPITLVVAFTPGGPSDVLARIVGKKMEQLLSQPFVIENRPGAGGNLAAEAVAHAVPDGYTLLMGNNSILATNDSLYKRLNYQPKDFVPITLIGTQANILVVNTNVPAHSLKELIALAEAQPGKLNLPLRGMARPRISLASCSSRRPRSISCTCPTKALRRPFKM
jgi:tripartite-type tricarboxylate transporter receptor subunit TctC